MKRTTMAVAAALAGNLAFAQSVYKCVTDGKVSYGDRPCERGPAAELALPAAARAGDAQRELARMQALSAKLEKERQARGGRDDRARARDARAAAQDDKRCATKRLKKRWLDEDLARSAGPAADPLRVKARRMGEELAIECPD